MADLIAELLERCHELERQFALSASRVWFRGQANAEWPLLPTALRDRFLDAAEAWIKAHPSEGVRSLHGHLGKSPIDRARAGIIVERVANERFRREAAPVLASPEDLSVVYMEARHAEMPSRLLDWTTRPLIALFFASLSQPERDGQILMLNAESQYHEIVRTGPSEHDGGFVAKVAVPVTDTSALVSSHTARLFESVRYTASWPSHFSSDFEVDISELGGVFPILPAHRLSRVAAQHSCFTFHPPQDEDHISNDQLLEPFRVPADSKKETLRNLRLLGIDESTIWPSLDGAAQAIRSSLDLP